MDEHCIAQMILVEKADGCKMIFYRTHNHDMRPKNFNLSGKTIATVADIIKARLKDDFILEHFQNKPKGHRDYFPKEKDIREICYHCLMNDECEYKNDLQILIATK